MRSHRLLVIAALASALTATGCSVPVFVVGQRGPGHPEGPPAAATVCVKAVAVHSDEPGIDAIARKLSRMLAERGYRLVPEADAQLILNFDYDVESLVARVHLRPISAAASGITTTRVRGPFNHNLSLWLVDGPAFRDEGREDVVWLGGAAIAQAPTTSERFLDLLIVQVFRNFPQETDGTKRVKMALSDARARALRP